ncbi:MAG TPA: hypothetical protein VJQ82_09940 [Terriglobales bacterium]|nr:hypothetical protein [Terriglobales bacterium]
MYTATPSKPAERPSALEAYTHDALDDLLYDWFLWEIGYSSSEGYSNQDRSFSKAQSSRQYETTAEILERQVANFLMPTITACVDELMSDLQIAIRIEQRNRLGPAVWRNPRAGDRQSDMYALAKVQIQPKLKKRGVEW